MLVLRWHPPIEPFRLRWIVPADVVAVLAQPAPLPKLAAVIGTPGERGPAGEDAPTATLVTEVPVTAGTPLAINRATGRFVAADALIYPRAVVVGLAEQDSVAGFAVDAKGSGSLEMSDWTAVTGSILLTPGLLYLLREGGGLTTTPPTARGSSVAVVGEATSPTTLNLRCSAPMLR